MFGYGENHLRAYSSLRLKTHTIQNSALLVVKYIRYIDYSKACQYRFGYSMYCCHFDTEQGFPWES